MDLLYGAHSMKGRALKAERLVDSNKNRTLSPSLSTLIGQQRHLSNRTQAIAVSSDHGVIAGMVGEITNFSDLCHIYSIDAAKDLDLIIRLYADHGFSSMRNLEGLYTAAIYDGQNKTLYVFQDPFSSPLSLYWTITDNILFFATSLKKLLLLSGITRMIDKEGLAHFMVNGFIPNKRTLLRDVYKLIPDKYLISNGNRIELKNLPRRLYRRYQVSSNSEDNAQKYFGILQRAFQKLTAPCIHEDLNVIVTSGFDSNFCLYIAGKEDGRKINAYCIGTRDNGMYAGESERAERIASNYDNVRFYKEDLSESTILRLPDIVWRLEGACCERGIFLRNNLARIVSPRANYIVGGDMANQVLNSRFHKKKIFRLKRSGHPVFWNSFWKKDVLVDEWKNCPREIGLYMNIKQNGLLMSTYSVQLKYLYLDQAFIDFALSLRSEFGDMREVHRNIVSTFLSDNVRQELDKPKITGIDESFYFQKRPLRERVASFLLNSDFLVSFAEKERLETLTRTFVECNDPKFTRIVTRLLYLDLWHAIFVSGDFDETFRGSAGFGYSLNDFLSAQ